ncbi:MAG TPA: NADH-quinone oxidoreductase subunit N [Dehalococcoidia bacterium]
MENVDRLAPVIILLSTGGLVLLADLFVRRKGWLVALALLGAGASLAWSAGLARREMQGTAFSGTVSVDNFTLFFYFLFPLVAAFVIMGSVDYLERLRGREGEFLALVLAIAGGAMVLAGGRDLIVIFVALELTSISQYALAGFQRDQKSAEAGLKYLLLGAVSSSVLLYGMALLYGISGTTSLEGIAQTVAAGEEGVRTGLVAAMVFLVAGFGFKMAVVPFQMWVPDVYEGSPTPVTAYLSVGSKAAGFAVVLRVFFQGLGGDFLSDDWSTLFAVIAALSMTLGNVVALTQSNIKRLLGYSSVAQAGYFLVGLAAVSGENGFQVGGAGVLFFLAGYAFTNLAAFIAVIAISGRIGSDRIADYAGVWRRSPFLALMLAFALVSLTGIPPTVGFIAKLYIFNAAVQADLVWLVVVAVVNTAISAYYYLAVVRTMFAAEPAEAGRFGPSAVTGVALTVAALGVLVFGVVPAPLIDAAEAAVRTFGQ